MPAANPDYTAKVAKWAAVSTLVLAVLYVVLGYVGEHGDPERDEPSVLLFVFMGAGVLALVSAAISIITCVASRLERRHGRANERQT
jgi:hypothetical protein